MAAAALLAFAAPAEPAPKKSPLQPGQAAFTERYVDALRAKDVARLKALVHPRSLDCMTPDNADFYGQIFARRTRHDAAGPYKASAKPVAAGEPLMMEGDLDYPVRPSHWIQIDLSAPAGFASILLVQVAPVNGTWYEVVPCPTVATLAKFRAAKAARPAQEKRAKQLVAELKDPLRTELRQLLSQGRRATATMRYNKETGETFEMAGLVLELLEAEQ